MDNNLMDNISDYRHVSDTRKNIPPAKIAAEGKSPKVKKTVYSYSPYRAPVLRFDTSGKADQIPQLLREAGTRALKEEEIRLLAEALRSQEPWLEWAGKREKKRLEIDPVELHIHERISTQAVLRAAKRMDIQKSLFADPEMEYHRAVQFYQHDMDWTNRMILGDSLQVMNSLSRMEDVAGKVQMIYMDPPYGIKFSSNFQPEVGNRDVKDRDQDLTREPEMVKAYRDTWELGKHSYLTYMRDRLLVAKELLADTGSIFVQISDENVHLIRNLMDEIFESKNFVGMISFVTTTSQTSNYVPCVTDFILWYGKDKEIIKYRKLLTQKDVESAKQSSYAKFEVNGEYLTKQPEQKEWNLLVFDNLTSRSGGQSTTIPFDFEGKIYVPRSGGWKTNAGGLKQLSKANRLFSKGNTLLYKRYFFDFPFLPLTNNWTDTQSGGFGKEIKAYIVQTNTKVIERCILMTTDPGDLILDPTCGSGSTAYVAEQWGRRWITIDTSRVALSIARQRLLTAKFDYYRLKDDSKGISAGFIYKTVPHITLKSIARNTDLDPVFEKHQPILDEKCNECNAALKKVSKSLRDKLKAKLAEKQKKEGKSAVTDADHRRWDLPEKGKIWEHWEIPFDTDEDWPADLQKSVSEYRKAWRMKMDEVNACIAAKADQEELVDQPETENKIIRVSGPFSLEAVQPAEICLENEEADFPVFDGAPEEMADSFKSEQSDMEQQNAQTFMEKMIRLLKTDGVRFPNNRQMKFSRLESLAGESAQLHAQGRWMPEGEKDPDPEGQATVCVLFGPQYGSVTAKMIEEAIRPAFRMGYDDLVIAGFSFDGAAQAVIEESQSMKIRVHAAHIRPEINPGMEGLLKEQPGSQLFSVFGLPRAELRGPDTESRYCICMQGVDIYDPVKNAVFSTGAEKVAAWFLDTDYDGRTFCITQAFFPDRSAWAKLSKALKGFIEPEAFEALSGTVSLPFKPGKHQRAAVKVIDPRGNEVMKILYMEQK